MEQSSQSSQELSWRIPFIIGFIALIVRVIWVSLFPDAYQFDAYQRWAGRDHLFIQVWLPATQVIVWLVGKMGGTMLILRAVFTLISALTIAMMTRLTQEVGSEKSGWFMLPLAFYGPYIVWSTVPYQESTLLFCILAGLLCHRRYPKLGHFFIGALALVRYEGWPLVLVHLALKRTWSSLIALWGMLLWGVIRFFNWLTPYMASPDTFSDWNELSDNLKPKKIQELLLNLWYMFDSSGGLWFMLFALPILWRWRQWKYEHWMLFIAFLGQCAAMFGWLFSLGIAFSRMTVLPIMLLGVLSTLGIQFFWERWSGWKKKSFAVFLVGLILWSQRDINIDMKMLLKPLRWDVDLAHDVQKCPGDVWGVYPRQHGGPRSRHDGCEVIQGLTNLRSGDDFNCLQWGWGGPQPTIVATWIESEKRYDVERMGGEGSPTCPY